MTLNKYRAPLLHYIKLCASSQTSWWIQAGVTVRKRSIRVKISGFFYPCDLEIWWMTLKNKSAPVLCYIKLCASFQSSIWVKIGDFLSRVTLKLYEWPWKKIEHRFYVASSFVHHFIAIGELKLKLQSGNAQFGSKSAIYCPVWP